MKRKITTLTALLCCFTAFALPSAAANTVATAEPMEQGKNYTYTYFTRIEDEFGWYADDEHYYSFTPSSTDEYTVEVTGTCINENTTIEIKSKSGMYLGFGSYNPYLNRVTATAKLNAGQAYYIEVYAGGDSSSPQVLTTSVSKHVHEFETRDYEKCTVTEYYDGDLVPNDGGYTKWCSICHKEEYVTFPSPATLKISSAKLTFNGKKQKPKVSIACEDGSAFTSYQVKYPDSKSPGKYKLTVTFTGDYTGTIKVPYTIVPGKPEAPKLKALKGGFQASWKKAGGADGYQVEWGIDKSFYWIDGQKNTRKPTCTLKKMYTKNSVVYVHVRAYKSVNGKKLYGSWSKGAKVKVK